MLGFERDPGGFISAVPICEEVTRTGEGSLCQSGAYRCASASLNHQILPATVCHVNLGKYCQYLQTALPQLRIDLPEDCQQITLGDSGKWTGLPL